MTTADRTAGWSPRRGATRVRVVAAGAAVGVLVTGVTVHATLRNAIGKDLGDILYAAFVYLALVTLVPRARREVPAAAALIWCVGVELWQLTSIPARISARNTLAGLALGSHFRGLDLVLYAVGVSIPAGLRARYGDRLAGDRPCRQQP